MIAAAPSQGQGEHAVQEDLSVRAEMRDGGALMQWFAGTWTSGLARDTLRRQVVGSSRSRDWMLRMPIDDYPILDVPSMDETAPYFDDWIEHETSSPWSLTLRRRPRYHDAAHPSALVLPVVSR